MLTYLYDTSGNMGGRAMSALLAPQITGQPVKQVAAPGEIVTFSVVVADARAVTFQWKFNGSDIPGSTGDSLLISNVSATNEGQYSVVVTNSVGSLTSTPAALLLDSDRDGLPDSWEIGNFGNTISQRGEGDFDRDTISNLDEFLDNTNPASPASQRFRLVAYSDAGGSVTVSPMKLSYELGEPVTLTAVPFASSTFIGWAGDLNTGDLTIPNPVTFQLTGNQTIRAKFATAAPIPSGLVAFWRGETDATDLIGGHDGSFFAGDVETAPTVTAFGKVGGAFDFDGTVHVRIPDNAALRPTQFTAEAWVLLTVPSIKRQTVVARGDFMNTWMLELVNDAPVFWWKGGLGKLPVNPIPLNEWTHLAISFDGMTKRLYVNGAEVASQKQLDALFYGAAPVPVTIGSEWSNNTGGRFFNGRIDEVALYNRALTADEVYSIYTSDLLGKNLSQPYFTSPSQLPDGVVGANYTQQLVTILGTPPISFSLTEGLLPPGITLSSTGLVSGVPATPGTFHFTVRATDSLGVFTEQLCTLKV